MNRGFVIVSRNLLVGVALAACSGSGLGPGGSASAGGDTGAPTGGTGAPAGGSPATGGVAQGLGGTPSPVCVPGATQACLGPGVCNGVQVCESDGSRWGSCDCGGAGNGGSPSSGGSGPLSTGGTFGESGGSPAGGNPAATGGSGPEGGSTQEVGGTPAAGGSSSTGGAVDLIGGSPAGGTSSTGGSSTGGSSASQYIQIIQGYSTDAAHGIAGPWYTYRDPVGTSIAPPCGTGETCYDDLTGTEACASGTAALVPCPSGVCDWDNYWGAGIGFHLNQGPEEGAAVGYWDGSAYQGVAFHIENTTTETIRAFLWVLGDDTLSYCVDVTPSGDYLISWQQFRQDCWTSGGAALPMSYLSQVNGVGWQIAASSVTSFSYGFCVSNLRIF